MDFREQLNEYNNTLNTLKQQCSEAEKQVIITETNIKNMTEQKNQLIEEYEAYAGVSINDAPQLINDKKAEIDEIMKRLSGIDISSDITQDKLNEINKIIDDFGIPRTEV